jgi:hypothetical protein
MPYGLFPLGCYDHTYTKHVVITSWKARDLNVSPIYTRSWGQG